MAGKGFSLRKAALKPRAALMLREGRGDTCRCAHSPSQTRSKCSGDDPQGDGGAPGGC